MNNNWHIEIAQCNEAQKERLKQVYGNQVVRGPYIGKDPEGNLAYYDVGELITPEQAFERLGLDDSLELQQEVTLLIARTLKAEEKVKELEQQLAEKPELPNEQGANRFGLDVAYFRNVINRELNRDLSNFKPSELARVLARMAKTADSEVLNEPEFIGKPELQGIDWSKAPEGATGVGQHGSSICWLKNKLVWNTHSGGWINSIKESDYTVITKRPKMKLTPEQVDAVKMLDKWLAQKSWNHHDLINKWLKEVGNE